MDGSAIHTRWRATVAFGAMAVQLDAQGKELASMRVCFPASFEASASLAERAICHQVVTRLEPHEHHTLVTDCSGVERGLNSRWKAMRGKSTWAGLWREVDDAVASIEDESYETWRKVHAVDLDSVFFACQQAIPLIATSGGGSCSPGVPASPMNGLTGPFWLGTK